MSRGDPPMRARILIAVGQELAERIVDTVSEPVRIGERELVVTASVGVAIFPEDGIDFEALLQQLVEMRLGAEVRGHTRQDDLVHAALAQRRLGRNQLSALGAQIAAEPLDGRIVQIQPGQPGDAHRALPAVHHLHLGAGVLPVEDAVTDLDAADPCPHSIHRPGGFVADARELLGAKRLIGVSTLVATSGAVKEALTSAARRLIASLNGSFIEGYLRSTIDRICSTTGKAFPQMTQSPPQPLPPSVTTSLSS